MSKRSAREQAAGYVGASLNSLRIAGRVLPEKHSKQRSIEALARKLERLLDDLGGIDAGPT